MIQMQPMQGPAGRSVPSGHPSCLETGLPGSGVFSSAPGLEPQKRLQRQGEGATWGELRSEGSRGWKVGCGK